MQASTYQPGPSSSICQACPATLRPAAPRLRHCDLPNLAVPLRQVAAEALEFASERLSQVQTVQVFAQQAREAEAFSHLSEAGYEMSRKYAMFQVSGVVAGGDGEGDGDGDGDGMWRAKQGEGWGHAGQGWPGAVSMVCKCALM